MCLVFNLCLSELLPLNYECSAKLFNENHGRYQRDALAPDIFSSDMKCERVDPAKKRMLKEKFRIAESYLGRFIGNILKHFTDERNVHGVRRLTVTSPHFLRLFCCLGMQMQFNARLEG